MKAASLSDILQELQDTTARRSENETSFINVRRSAIWDDTLRQLNRKKFNPAAKISVRFADDDGSSEGAVDAGGPCREFLRLLIKAVNEHSNVFAGPERNRVLNANVQPILNIINTK